MVPLTVDDILARFRVATERNLVDSFWLSRKKGKLVPNPESHCGAVLLAFVEGALSRTLEGIVIRELATGIGYVDVGLLIGNSTLNLIELKVVSNQVEGPSQLAEYMRLHERPEGWLVLFDSRDPNGREAIPDQYVLPEGTVHNLVVDINPIAPSELN